jgi:general stress protein 26
MNSINRNQPEKNHDDLSGREAIEQVRTIVGKAETCFFCTKSRVEGSSGARPMDVREVDSQGNLWFLSAVDSHLNQELALDRSVTLYLQGSPHSDFLQIHGQAAITTDKSRIKELWTPIIKTWFTQGVDDPRIIVVKVMPTDGYYWDTKHGNFVAGAKMLLGALIGKTLDDSIEGTSCHGSMSCFIRFSSCRFARCSICGRNFMKSF